MARIALAAMLVAVTAVPAGARLHTRLTKSTPAAEAALRASPKTIELWWNEKPEVSLSTVTVQGADSAKVGLGKLRGSTDLMGVAADVTAPLAPGKYVVKWKTAGKDGHAVRGSFNFSISK
jgi:methionine-rich copper-binding protein CopC